MRENQLLLRRNSIQSLFNGYYFDSVVAKADNEEILKKEKAEKAEKLTKNTTAMKPTDLSSMPQQITSKPKENDNADSGEEEESESEKSS